MRFDIQHDWTRLSQEAAILGLYVAAKTSIKELTEILAEKTEEAERLVKASEAGDLTDSQNARWKSLMDEETGEIPKLTAELAEARRIENEKKGLAAARLAMQGQQYPFDTEFNRGTTGSPLSRGNAPRFRNLSTGQDICALGPNERFDGSEGDNAPAVVGNLIHSLVTGEPMAAGTGHRNELIGGTDDSGGYILNPSLSGTVIDLARSASVAMRAGAVTLPMDSREMHIARLTQDPTAQWRAEGTAVQSSTLGFDRVTLRAKTLAAIVPVTIELLEDASNVGTIINQALQAALGQALDNAILFGDGAEENPRGIRNADGVNAIAAVGTPADYSKITGAVGDILGANYSGPISGLSWITNPRDGETFDGLTDSTGQPLNPTPWARDLSRFSTTSLPTDEGGGSNESVSIVGDFSQVLVGMRTSGVTIRVMDQGQVSDGTVTHNAASELKKLIVAYLRADVALLRPSWMTVLSGITA